MTNSPDALHGYHIHIYFDERTKPTAERLRDELAARFPVQVGRIAGIAGPHPVPQTAVIFKKEAFDQVVRWLMLNRAGLNILVHPLSDNQYDDHGANALWLGTPVALLMDTLPHGPYPMRLLPGAAATATAP